MYVWMYVRICVCVCTCVKTARLQSGVQLVKKVIDICKGRWTGDEMVFEDVKGD